MIKISNIKLGINQELTRDVIASQLKVKLQDILSYRLYQKSVDARKKSDINYICTVLADVKNEKKQLQKKNVTLFLEEKYEFLDKKINIKRPVIVGSGPAGLFCALCLARSGLKPILIERGAEVEERVSIVKDFWENKKFSKNTNVQFGEGGAGTFSDGKLTTGINDIRLKFIKEEFVKFGAPKEILYLKKPHIGTDNLVSIVKNIRNELIGLGCDVRFNTKLQRLVIKDNSVSGLECECMGEKYTITTDNVILAIGHSARDTIKMLRDCGIEMMRKTFSIGGRIEHLQKDISFSQYGDCALDLPPAEYKLSVKTKDDRGVYTFCMCPGGYVVASASEEGTVVTNGMSYFSRDGENANSAVLVTVNPDDIEGDDVLGGIYLQENIEKKAFIESGGDYSAPIQLVGDFINDRKSTEFGKVIPTYKPKTTFCEIKNILPPFITESMREALILMDKKIKGFADSDAVITVPETRSSSPVRIVRDDFNLMSNIKGLYPCGEGAGYAGGIMSAALDGIKCAEALVKNN